MHFELNREIKIQNIRFFAKTIKMTILGLTLFWMGFLMDAKRIGGL